MRSGWFVVPQVVPVPPFRLSLVVAGPTILVAVRKDGDVRYLASIALADEPDIRRRDLAGTLKCAAGADLPPGGRAVLERAAVTLTAGVGQADFRIVTDGPGCRPYMENGRIFTAFAEMPDGSPYRYILLTMDRQNFPGMPKPNWTYGANP